MVHLMIPKLVVSGMERSTWSPKPQGLSHLYLFIWSQGLLKICPVYEQKAAHHSRNGEHLPLRYSNIS